MRTNIGLEVVSAPAAEPVSLTNQKAFMRIDTSADDSLINALISAARQHIESITGRAIINRTLAQWYDRFPENPAASPDRHRSDWWNGIKQGPVSWITPGASNYLELLRSPVSSITSIKTYDTDDSESTFAATNYRLDDSTYQARVVLVQGAVWPVNLRTSKAIKITYVAGYGNSADNVPSDLVHAVKQLVTHFYENRCPVEPEQHYELPMSISALLAPYKMHEI